MPDLEDVLTKIYKFKKSLDEMKEFMNRFEDLFGTLEGNYDLCGNQEIKMNRLFKIIDDAMIHKKVPMKDIDIAKIGISAMEEDCAYDQICHHGYRVGTHAVYCENYGWDRHPRKCKDLDCEKNCEGFEPNPNYKKSEE